MEFILGFITATFIFLVVNILWSKNSKGRPKNNERKPESNVSLIEEIKSRGEADAQVRKRLISILGGDEEQAETLVARKRFAKEGKYSENYYWWLVIRDLERKGNNE